MKRLKNVIVNRKDIVSGRILLNVLEKADSDGLKHAVCVAEIAEIIASGAGLGKTGRAELWLAGLLHDIGKLGVPAEILSRRKVTKSDKRYLRKHVTIGRYIVDRFFSGGALGRTVEAHHERHDGKGYPRGLAGEDVPFDARIIAIADYYDTARSAGWLLVHRSHETVMREINDLAGSQFDPALVKVAVSKSVDIQVVHKSVHAASVRDLIKWL